MTWRQTTAPVGIVIWILLALVPTLQAAEQDRLAPGEQAGQGAEGPEPTESFDPAQAIRIYEGTASGRIKVYVPGETKTTQLSVDEDSTIVLEPVFRGDDFLLNNLFMSASLASGDVSSSLQVAGYSEIGTAKETARAQRGMRFESAANIQAMLLNFAFTVHDIVNFVYDEPGNATVNEERLRPPATIEQLARARERFSLYRAEIAAISEFFLDDDNLALIELIGTEVFWVDRDSMQAIAGQYTANMGVA